MKKNDIIKLINLTIEKERINKDVVGYILSKLKKAELKLFLFYLREKMRKETVNVFSADEIDKEFRDYLEKIFKGRKVNYFIDFSLGGGFRIEYDYNILDISIKNTLIKTFNNIKENI